MRMGGFLCVLTYIWVFTVPAFARTYDLSKFNWQRQSHDFTINKGVFLGNWPYLNRWEGWFCNGYYETNTQVQGRISNLQTYLNQDLSLTVDGELSQLSLEVDAVYRGEMTSCFSVGLGHQITIDKVTLQAQALVTDDPNSDKPLVTVKILGTQLGQVVYDRYLPNWFQAELTNGLNQTLQNVWASKMGEWISTVISQQIEQNLSDP